MSELIRREDALKAVEANRQVAVITQSVCTTAGQAEMWRFRIGAHQCDLDDIVALPAIGTCKDCANGHPHGPDIRCAYLWEILMHVEDASSIFRADPSLVGPDDFCSLYKEAKADA